MLYSFEDFSLDTARRELRRGGALIALQPQVFDLLEYAIRNRERVVSKDDLLTAVWHGRIVSESTLSTRINAARNAISDSGEEQRLLRTTHGKGIRFVGVVREEEDAVAIIGVVVPKPEPPSPPALPEKLSIAVLPFHNLSGDPEQEHFADGVVEEIITALSRIRWLFVIARNSSYTYKGQSVDVKRVGRELGVRYVLEGSVRNAGGRLRVTAQLIDSATGAHLWAEHFDGSLDAVFEFQDQVAINVAAAIESALQPVEIDRSASLPEQAMARDAKPPEPISAERRQLTVMSCNLVDSTALASRLDPEDLRDLIADYHRIIAEIITRFAGFVAKHLSDGVLIYFGYPSAHEDDAERAIRCALTVADTVIRFQLDEQLRTRVGIATSMVVVGASIDSDGVPERSVVGEAPGLAAQLRDLAAPNSVVIAESTRRLVGELFEYRAVEVAGHPGRVSAWQVLRPSAVESRFEALRGSALTRLVGRDEEIDLLLRRWARAKAGDGQVVLVSGEAGIGKSRITAALEERLHTEPHICLRYFCSPYHQDSALFPFVYQLSRASGFARDDAPAVKLEKLEALLTLAAPQDEDVALLADLLSLPGSERHPLPNLSPQRKKERILEALIRQLDGLARRQPVVMVFEDAHWIDPTSRELLDLTVERVRSLPVLLIVTFRLEFQPPWAGQPQVSMVALNRLDRRDRTFLVGQIAGGKALPEEVIRQIVDRTDGVPLFVEELTKSVLESGLLREEAVVEASADRGNASISAVPASSLAVPATLHASLLGRLDRLGSAAKTVAQVGAAVGRDFSHELLAAAAPLAEPELQEALRRLVEAGLVFQRGAPPMAEYLFKHALVQDTAYSTLLRGPRQALHRRIAEALEQRFPDLVETRPEILAHHYGEAAMADKAVTYWHLAGKLSVAKSAVREATAQLRRGLSLLDGLPETRERKQLKLDTHITLTTALMTGKGYSDPEVVAALERANRLVTETASVGSPLHFFVLYGLWISTLNGGTVAAALEHATNFLSVAQSQPSSGPLLVAHRSLARSLMLSGDHRAALAHFETAASLYRPDEHRDSAFRYGQDIGVTAFVQLSWALWHCGYPDRSARAADRALAYSRQLGHAHTLSHALCLAGMAAALARDVATACAYGNDCVALASEHGFAQWTAWGRILQGWADAQRGEATTGIACIHDGLAATEATGARVHIPLFLALLAEALTVAGKIEEGLATLDDALATAAVSGERGWSAEIHRLHGELTVRLPHPDPAKAEDSFRTALAIAREQGTRGYELRAATSLARLWREQGRRDEAHDLLAPVYDRFTEGFGTTDLKEAKTLLDELDQSLSR